MDRPHGPLQRSACGLAEFPNISAGQERRHNVSPRLGGGGWGSGCCLPNTSTRTGATRMSLLRAENPTLVRRLLDRIRLEIAEVERLCG